MSHSIMGSAEAVAGPVRRTTALHEDPQLARMLSRLAALQGHAVPAHRFGIQVSAQEGVSLDGISRPSRALTLWQARFPQGAVEELALDRVNRGNFPLLWFSGDLKTVLLLRGRLGNHAYAGETADGQSIELGVDEGRGGVAIALRTTEAQPGDAAYHKRTATEWFAVAIRRYRRIFLEAVVATFALNLIGLMVAMYTMQVYDRVLPARGYSTLWVLTVGVTIAILIEFAMRHVRENLVERACNVIDQELSTVFFGKALDIRLDARPKTVGTFASQIRQFESVRNFLTASTLFILADAPFAVFFIAVIWFIGGPIALVPTILVPIAILAGLAFSGPIERLTMEHMAESNRKNGMLIEAVDGIESVKSVSGEWKMLDQWRYLVAKMADTDLKMRAIGLVSSNIAHVIQQLGYIGLVAAGAYAITQGQLTMGGLIACTIISGRALSPLARIPQLIVQWKHAKIALASLDTIMAMPGEREDHRRLLVPDHCVGQLRLEKAGFAYVPEHPVIEVPSLSIHPGERIAVIGAVGSGKSTFIKLLSGLYKPGTGAVYLDDVDLTHLAPEFVREHVGYLPQDVRLFNGTLRDNLTLGLPTPSDEQILHAARLTGLDLMLRAHPKGLGLEITEGGHGLSGGQRQLVGLTRMLLAQPRILLLDEPTASMDAQLEMRVVTHLFQEIAQDSIVVLVTHKLSLLPLVDRIIVLDQGRIVVDGPRNAVIEAMRKSAGQQANGG